MKIDNPPLHGGQGTGSVMARIHALLVVSNDSFVIQRRHMPKPSELLQIVVFSLFRVAANQPDRFEYPWFVVRWE